MPKYAFIQRIARFAQACDDFGGNVKSWSGTVERQPEFNFHCNACRQYERVGLFDLYSRSLFVDHQLYAVLQYPALRGHLRKLALHMSSLYPHSFPLTPHEMPLAVQHKPLTPHFSRLATIDTPLQEHYPGLNKPNNDEQPCEKFDPSLYLHVIGSLCCVLLWVWGVYLLDVYRLRRRGYFLIFLGSVGLLSVLGDYAFGSPLAFWRFRWLLGKDEDCEYQPLHSEEIVSRKYLTTFSYCNTVSDMANVLSAEKQTAIIAALAEGSSIRSIERITGVHRDTIMRLGVKVGQGCTKLMDSKMQDLDCNLLQFDELWGFIGKKERHCSVDDNPTLGDVWTFCAIDSETKLVPSFKVGKRTHATTTEFVQDVASRMRHRVQVSSDAMHLYIEAMELAFGSDVDYGQCVKVYAHDAAQHPERKYSAPHFASAYRRPITGNPEMELVSTSHVERLNATTRLHMRRLTRLTLAFSKKLENFEAAVGLHFAYYNFVKRHCTLRCTPAMAAGVERDFWSVGDLVEAAI
jgi:IS1 family transposase